jgi:hypothetical protein
MATLDASGSPSVSSRASGVLRWPWVVTSALLALPALLSQAGAQEAVPPSAPHGTNLRGRDGNETASSLLSFACSYAWENEARRVNPRKVMCRFATTSIARPSALQIEQRLRSLDAPDRPKDGPEDFPGVCKEIAAEKARADAHGSAGPHRVYYEQLSKACAAEDAAAGKAALRFGITEVWARTCEAVNHRVREHEFQKVDDLTWRAMDGGAAGGTSTIRTIWRKKAANEFSSWHYKQVTSGDPACVPGPFGECAKDATNEWTTEAPVVVTGCQFFK